MNYYRPNWESIHQKIDKEIPEEDRNNAWLKECDRWLQTLIQELGDSYHTIESENFIILSSESDDYEQYFLKFLEFSRNKILQTLEGIASDDGYGKHVVFIAADQETYYDYILMFYPDEAKVGLSSGVYLNDGYGHFVFPSHEINYTEPVAVHELTHACLSHLPIPNWLNEGLAVSMEDVVLTRHYFEINKEIVSKHQQYWDQKNIQSFWKGKSFSNTDEGQELSYHLAQLLVQNISRDYEQFVGFSNHAHHKDAGQEASQKHLNICLGDLLTGLLGEGDWSPKTKSQNTTEVNYSISF